MRFDNTLQDILIRHARLKGKDALWVAGTDHAGIATQMVVERQLNAEGQKRTDFSRDDFIAKVWEMERGNRWADHKTSLSKLAARWIGRMNASR